MTFSEAADLLNVRVSYVHELVAQGVLTEHLTREELEAYNLRRHREISEALAEIAGMLKASSIEFGPSVVLLRHS